MRIRKFLSLFTRFESFNNKNNNVLFNVKSINIGKNQENFVIQKMGCSTSKTSISITKPNKPDNDAATTSPDDDEYVEGVVCKTTDINDNEMKTFDLADAGRILLIKQHGKLSAIGAKCTHYGAPLVNGALGEGRVRCQWHGACFNITTGDIEDFPGLDSLPCYQVTIDDTSGVRVRAKRADLESNKRTNAIRDTDHVDDNIERIVVIGGGPAGATCVETLRQRGFRGRVTLVCREPCLPYDRVKVSKAMDFEIEKAQFRSAQFYTDWNIEVLLGIEATSVSTTKRQVELSNGNCLEYDRLFVATGSKAEKTKIPGADLQNIVVLRDYEHSVYTQAQLNPECEVVVLGSSFVAMEAANYCLNKVKRVTLIARGNAPFKALLGEEIGLAFMALFKEKGVNFVMNSGLVRCIDSTNTAGKVDSVELKDGTILPADLVIMGVGSSFYTKFLDRSGIDLRPDGSIEVDSYLETNVANVYAGGDIAYAPVWSWHNQKATIGHYPLAHYHGRIAATNMLENRSRKMEAVPYFWTMLFGKGVRYAGHGQYTDIIYLGDVQGLKFVAFYLDDKDEVVAVSSCAMDPVVSQFAELLAQNKKLYRKDVEGDNKLAWTKKLTDHTTNN